MKSIILIGFMGTGKDAVAEALSKKLKVPAYDTDEIISKQKIMEDWEIVSVYGEKVFRTLETKALVQLHEDALLGTGTGRELGACSDKMPGFDRIITCGSGIVLSEFNCGIMKEMGKIILLESKPKNIQKNVRRLSENRHLLRPFIGDGSIPAIERILNERKKIYYSIADQVIQVDGKTVDQICKEIVDDKNVLSL